MTPRRGKARLEVDKLARARRFGLVLRVMVSTTEVGL